MSDSEDLFGDNSRINAESRSISTDSLRGDVTFIEESQSLLLPLYSAGNNSRETDRSDQNKENEIPTQIDNSHLLLGMVQGIKRSMETVEKEMKRIKEKNVALDKKVSSVLKKHENIEKYREAVKELGVKKFKGLEKKRKVYYVLLYCIFLRRLTV